jgi:nucleoside-diphosphate-sugar epimerase
MRRILVTGGLGKLGRSLLNALHKRGFQIRVLRLPNEALPPSLPLGLEVVTGDVADASSLIGIAEGIDVVLHAAAILQAANPNDFERINHQGTRHLLRESHRAGVKHFILVSSISVTYPVLSPYALSKKQAEAALGAFDFSLKTIVRPTLIYDDEGGASEFAVLVKYVAKFPWVALPNGGCAQKRPVHAEDAANCLSRIPMEPICSGKIYALAGQDILTMRQMVEKIAEVLEMKRRIWNVPIPLAYAGARLAQTICRGGALGLQGLNGLVQDAAPDISALVNDLGYSPRSFSPTPSSLSKAVGK